ncbi:MurR/RpiR family transcriptional regulator [Natribacillus halophilus]|uniref:DNA-binding transcriptional regulator, MurR/RpiR family, contains HTH and SIS domains n=1 Tax=Natribacillus halophilus TaxID=549003 RepID=A0A1G8P353_9BACI|nr:MurR/RpiR family transcriptional regulator [Natribacillus halophilus]SDI86909.1 DNA-binding transcriptional regulator, MurR/RpiR family, contains HTH and SIS domains [Natribacillus halophilus]
MDLVHENNRIVTKAEKLVIDYILENKKEVTYMTASKISKEVGVGKTTVVRLASSLGYENFSHMQSSLQEEFIKHQLNERMQDVSENIDNDNAMIKSINKDIANIQATVDNINMNEFEEAIKLIGGSKGIYTIGFRSSIADAYYLGITLKKMLGNTFPITSTGVILDHCFQNANENSVVIAFSFPRYTMQTIESVRYLKEQNKVKVISITDSIKSPLVTISDYFFLTSAKSLSPLYSHVSSMALINAIIATVGQYYNERVTKNLILEEEEISRRNVFYL